MAQYKRYTQLLRQACRRHLDIVGGFHPDAGDGFSPDVQTILLLGPWEARFWKFFETVPEYWDGQADPMDRWSRRVIDSWAARLDAQAFYPFGAAPHHPFYHWALKTGRCHASPVKLLVHDDAGMWVSFRGALALTDRVDLPPPPPSPCEACHEQPCKTACPVEALTVDGYDVEKCKSYLIGDPEVLQGYNICMASGCSVRESCPISRRTGRRDAHSSYHMNIFVAS